MVSERTPAIFDYPLPDRRRTKKWISLIVEGDASFRRALERLLRASGFDTHTFASAEEFLRSAAPESHACPILNINLSGCRASS
jgi:FixJ family two-component response regulator